MRFNTLTLYISHLPSLTGQIRQEHEENIRSKIMEIKKFRYPDINCIDCGKKTESYAPTKVRCSACAIVRHQILDKGYQKKIRQCSTTNKERYRLLYLKKSKLQKDAHATLNAEIRKGTIKRGKCRDCDRRDVHAHHPNYKKPLDIVWLCPSHHKLEHLRLLK